jgi:3-dehydroquinate synthase
VRQRLINTSQSAYPLHIGAGSRDHLDGELQRLAPFAVAVLADQTVLGLHGQTLRRHIPATAVLLSIPPGEVNKNLSTAASLYDALAQAEFGRDGIILAFGGGMTGDLAGFVAATWHRGLPYIQLPTTLEAAVDACIGGKTGVNHASGKNLIGAFHQPAAVIVDLDFLATLPGRDLCAGLAECVKHGSTCDPALLSWLELHADAILARDVGVLEELIDCNCEIKAELIARDEREQGVRVVLNHGHTIGHALEQVLGYELRHGECVALGMVAENAVAERRGWLSRPEAARIRALLERFHLPTRAPGAVDPDLVTAACRADKKKRGGMVQAVLLRGLGSPQRTEVTDDEIRGALTL